MDDVDDFWGVSEYTHKDELEPMTKISKRIAQTQLKNDTFIGALIFKNKIH